MADFKILCKNTINSSLSNRTQLSIKPQMSISTLYGTIKDHKENNPLRPIGTAYDSLTLGAEQFISKLLEPLRQNCTYAINSQIKFKNEFLKFQPNFDPETQEIFTLDVNSLFPNINNTRTINYILNEVYEAPGKFFVEKNKQGKTLPAPSREKFRQFLHGVLNSFNIFRCHIGVFSQKKGVKMGSPLSSLFADLFLGILERTVIAKLERQGHIFKWLRYADDCIVVGKKGSFEHILNKVNRWDKDIEFSYEKMIDNELTFLSSTIFLTNGSFEFRPSRKNGAETILTNFNKATISEKYLVSNIFTMLHHSQNSSSSHDILLNDMENNLKPILLNNGYPLKTINSNYFKFLRNGPKPKPPDVNFSLSIPYTSKTIDYHIKKLIAQIKVVMPNFHVRLAYKGIKLSNLFSADAKQKISEEIQTTNCVYHFKCLCLSHYVGMTARTIKARATEHRNPSSAKGIYYHIHSCPNYLSRLSIFESENFKPSDGVRTRKKLRDKFFMQHFRVLQRSFGSYYDRRKTEAFFIRILRPDLNEQNKHRYFTLF